ncbi:hypothetical protein CA85_52560 [Allorhodopirellula solitaria]|uniref:Uncharacterized protein n=1 Tax=Allorhodopirellula solitaria TaxID=2527987 RepID=A0A5C5WN99_9BACT|nr:hypothetical protein CA85_52560 [Allorhodopirellula solitaria]
MMTERRGHRPRRGESLAAARISPPFWHKVAIVLVLSETVLVLVIEMAQPRPNQSSTTIDSTSTVCQSDTSLLHSTFRNR